MYTYVYMYVCMYVCDKYLYIYDKETYLERYLWEGKKCACMYIGMRTCSCECVNVCLCGSACMYIFISFACEEACLEKYIGRSVCMYVMCILTYVCNISLHQD